MTIDFDGIADRSYDRGRADAIEECASIAQRWADECAEFTDDPRCLAQHNTCRNLAKAMRALVGGSSKP